MMKETLHSSAQSSTPKNDTSTAPDPSIVPTAATSAPSTGATPSIPFATLTQTDLIKTEIELSDESYSETHQSDTGDCFESVIDISETKFYEQPMTSQSETGDCFESEIDISETKFYEQPITSQSAVFDEMPGTSKSNTSKKRKAEETIMSDSKYLKANDVDSALQKLEQTSDSSTQSSTPGDVTSTFPTDTMPQGHLLVLKLIPLKQKLDC
ncbi:hypothetical protein L9F63_013337 [Diploptera punctata]|uniref:Uncharacterized protein n=1 Tax=Diploptera punctata TaxID=6984 RepID=A0AAD8AAJ5_DIPPU|nr:hypothetical protein L9F63_013337 [Diploptera punctata]